MFSFPVPLAPILSQLRGGALDLKRQIGASCHRIDRCEELLQALIPEPGRKERLLREAEVLVARHPDPAGRPPLYGILVGVKDIIRVDSFSTGAGSRLPPHLFAGPQASCITALRRAGALVLGKTRTTEFAGFDPGPTANPRRPGHTPGGSSSGSAAAVAAGYCPLALGTQTIGSVVRPAAYCGVVGFKPSLGRIDTAGLLDFSPAVDTVGMFTQDLAGMGSVAAVLCRGWRQRTEADKPVLGVPQGPYLKQATAAGLEAFGEQVVSLREAGFVVRRVPLLEDIEEINRRHWHLVQREFAGVHQDWFETHGHLYGEGSAGVLRQGRRIDAAEYDRGLAGRMQLRRTLEAKMQEEGIDLWICPAATGAAPAGLETTGDPAMNLPWTHAGVPVLNLPAGRSSNGLPLGLQCAAAFGRDESLLAWGQYLSSSLDAGG
jgi:Asp-tRNA(Asn)/Glu-tRNA(Gln) amidotransferase A subunit family amidase